LQGQDNGTDDANGHRRAVIVTHRKDAVPPDDVLHSLKALFSMVAAVVPSSNAARTAPETDHREILQTGIIFRDYTFDIQGPLACIHERNKESRQRLISLTK